MKIHVDTINAISDSSEYTQFHRIAGLTHKIGSGVSAAKKLYEYQQGRHNDGLMLVINQNVIN